MSDPIVTIPAVRQHLRLEDDYPVEQLQIYVSAACLSAQAFLNRRIYATAEDKAAAILDLPDLLGEAMLARSAALEAADLMVDTKLRCAARADAEADFSAAQAAATEVRRSIVADERVEAAILLIVGHLFQNRQDGTSMAVSELPMGSRSLLQPLRIGLGV